MGNQKLNKPMKYIIIALLLSSSVVAQTKYTPKLSGTITLDSASTFGASQYYDFSKSFINPVREYHLLIGSNKILMKVSQKDQDNEFKVWIDKKAIVWTSDSAFILKPKL